MYQLLIIALSHLLLRALDQTIVILLKYLRVTIIICSKYRTINSLNSFIHKKRSTGGQCFEW